MREISESRLTYGIENIRITEAERSSLRERRRSSPYSNELDIIGLEEDVKTLRARLVEGDTRCCMISIVGMGGIGKTTLAKKIYNSSVVGLHFHIRAWVYVSQVYNTTELLQDMCKKVMDNFAGDTLTIEQMEERLSDFLKEKRYIIVMDDVWTTQVWESVKAVFPLTTNGMQGRGDETPEDVVEDYIEDLIERSLIQVAAKRSDGKIKTCRMHDLVRDLSLSKAKEANFVHVYENIDSTSTDAVKVRRHAAHYTISKLPSFTEHLRSLSLILGHELRHLYLNWDPGCRMFYPSPDSSNSSCHLRYLQTLSRICLDEEISPKGGLDKSIDLKKLKISGNLDAQGEELAEWLVKLDHLKVLVMKPSFSLEHPYIIPRLMPFSNKEHLYKLHFGGRFTEKLLDLHEFPPNLTMLILDSCELDKDPLPMLEKLQNLKILKLMSAYVGKNMVCSSGGFLRLQLLKVWSLKALEIWTVEEGAMQSLRVLELRGCEQLKMIPDGLMCVTALRELKVTYIPERFRTRVQANGGRGRIGVRLHIYHLLF
ncbi:hypothetical protein HHK36_025381 [Tetracentron sinense]|uniref:NB-ARC domain-containing protein n=1 Tax=Tetracentron sinense TaxID=13715 RepID=A0A834YN32_TETSI|nr:hypothetical protein HHK36_025381 [Tetracentron sinense]